MLARDLLLADPATDSILRFDGVTGAPLGTFVASGSGGLVDPHDPMFGPDKNLYVFSNAAGARKILRYDGQTGAPMGTFVDIGSGGFAGGTYMDFGPDGNLYVATGGSNVLRYHGGTGAFLGVAASGQGIRRACGIDFGPDGNLYVLDADSANNTGYDRILRFNPATDSFLDVFVQSGSLEDTCAFTFGPDGHIYVPDAHQRQTFSFNGTTGKLQQAYGGDGAPMDAVGFDVVLGPDGNAYVPTGLRVLRYEGETGDFLGTFVDEAGGSITFFPPAGPPADLSVTIDSFSAQALIGEDLSVTFTVQNHAASPVPVDEWVDVLYLSRDNVFDSFDYELGRVAHAGGLPAMSSYTKTLTVPAPELAADDYHIIAVTDRRGAVPETLRANNIDVTASRTTILPLAENVAPANTLAVGRTLSSWTTDGLVGNELTISYTVYNLTTDFVSEVTFQTELEPGVQFGSASSLPDVVAGQSLSWDLGRLGPLGTATVDVHVTLDNLAILQLDGGASATGKVNFSEVVADAAHPAVLRNDPMDPTLLSPTPDANSGDLFIRAKAAELNQNAHEIFAFVAQQIGFESYEGSLRGARGTLWSSAGNALDQSSLLVALLRASGIESRYVAGTLPDNQAQQLILSMFSEPLRSIGFIPDGAARSNPANDPALLQEARSHFWVQFDAGLGFQDADPSIAGAAVGDAFAPVTATFAEVDDALRHTLRLQLAREMVNTASALFFGGASLSRTPVLDLTFNTVELTGRPLTIGHFVDRHTIATPLFTSITNRYSPYLAVGDYAQPIGAQELIPGTDYQETITNFPLGTQVLTGLFVTLETHHPGGAVETIERALLDLIGAAVRTNGGAPNLNFDPAGPPTLTDSDYFTVNVAVGLTRPDLANALTQEIASLQSRILDLQLAEGLRSSSASNLHRQMLINATRLNAVNYLALSDFDSLRLAALYQVRAYAGQPRIIITTLEVDTHSQANTAKVSMRIDLRSNQLRVIARPTQNEAAEKVYRYTRGTRESELETRVLQQQADRLGNTKPIISTVSVFAAAEDQGIPLVELADFNSGQLDGLDFSADAKARISHALQSGRSVIVPARSVDLGGQPTVAWLEIDPVSGESIGVTEDGGHQAISEWGSNLTIIGIELSVLQSVLLVFINVLWNPKCQPGGEGFKACKDAIGDQGNVATVVSGADAAGSVGGLGAAIVGGVFGALITQLLLLPLGDPPAPEFLVTPEQPLDELAHLAGSGVVVEVARDPVLYLPINGSLVPTVYRVGIKNEEATDQRFDLQVVDVPAGFEAVTSVPDIAVPAGQTAEVGLALRPVGPLPPPGTVTSFAVQVASSSDGSITRTHTEPFVVPEIHGLRLLADPIEVSTVPGVGVDVALVLEAVGNVGEVVSLDVSLSQGLSLAGLSDATLGPHELQVQILTLTPDAGVPLNTQLVATITADFGAPEPITLQIPVRVTAPGVEGANRAALFARDFFGQDDLADRLDDLSIALTNLSQDADDAVFKSQAVASLDSVLSLLAVDPILHHFVDDLQAPRDALAAAQTPAEVLAALNQVGTTLDDFATAMFFQNEFNFELFLLPNSQVAQPQVPTQYELLIHHIGGVTPGTFNISLSGLPASVIGDLSETQVTLNRDEFATVIVTLTQDSPEELLAFNFRVDVSVEGFPEIAKSVTGSLAARDEFVSVVSVRAEPTFTDAGGQVDVSARVLNAVNRAQQAEASFLVKDANGQPIGPASAPVDVALTLQASLVDVALGSIDTTGLADGYYSIEVMLTDADGQPIPGAIGRGVLLVGSPLEASLEVGPELLPPGTHTVDNALEINATAFPVNPPELVGQRAVAGASDAVRNGDYVYVAGTAGITVLNIAGANVNDPQFVRVVGSATSMLRMRGNLLVATLGRPGGASTRVDTYSLTDPANPALLGTTGDIPYGSATDVVLSDTHAFIVIVNLIFAAGPDVLTQNGGMFAVNISNPAAPFFDGDALTPPVSNPARRDGVDDGVLFNVNGSNNDGVGVVLGFDLSGGNQMTWGAALASPTILYLVGSSATGTDTQTGAGLVRVVDISDPRNMRLLRDLVIPGTVHILDIAVQGDRALVTGTEGGLADFTPGTPFTGNVVQATLDLTDPANPQIIDNDVLSRAARSIDRNVSLGGGLFAFSNRGGAGDQPGLFVAHENAPGSFLGLDVPAEIIGLSANDGLIFTADGNSLIIYQIPSPAPLALLGHVPIPGGSNRGIAARNQVAYACSASGIRVIDYSDPTNPTLLTTVGSGAHIGCRLQDDLLLAERELAGRRWVLEVYSIQNNPLSPVLLGSTPTINYTNLTSGLESTNTHAFLTQFQVCFLTPSNDIYVHMGEMFSIALNLNDPDNPTSAAPDLVNVLFNTFGDSSPNSVVVDVSGCPQNGGDHNVFGIAMADPQTAYLAASSVVGGNTQAGVGGVHVVDVTDPSTPSLVRNLDIPGTVQAVGIGIAGDTAVVIGSTDGWVDPFTGLRNGNLTVTTLDLSDPHDPRIVAHQVLDRRARTFWTNTGTLGGKLFAFSSIDFESGNLNPDLLLIDVSNPRNPSVTSTGIPLDTIPPNSISFDGQYVFTSDSTGISIYEINEIPIPVTADVQIPNGTGVEVVPGSFNIPPDQILVGADFNTLVWNTTLSAIRPSLRLTWDTTVTDLQPGEARRVTLETVIDFGYQGSPGQITLPPQRVAAEQVMSLSPDTQTVAPGETAEYTVTFVNPSGLDVLYDLSVAGVPAEWVEIESPVLVPANGAAPAMLRLTSDPFAALAEHGFVVHATVDGVTTSVQGSLVLAGAPVLPDPQRHARGVVLEVIPTTATAGQGTAASYTARVTNTGSAADSFVVFISGLPAEFATTVGTGVFEVQPGASNYFDIPLTIVPPPGTAAGDYPFLVTVSSLTDATITSVAEANLNVLGVGVRVEISPGAGPDKSTFELTVINTDVVAETFDLSLAGPAALVSTLGATSVHLGPCESIVVPIHVGAIDFAFAGSLSLVGVARSRTGPDVRDAAEAFVEISEVRAMDARIDPASVILPQPSAAEGVLLIVDNLGNVEDAYEAVIQGTTGPVGAQLVGLDGNPAASVPIFRLPGLGTASFSLRASLLAAGDATVTVRVRSLTDPDLFVDRLFHLSTSASNVPPTADAGGPYTVVAGESVQLQGTGTDPDGPDEQLIFVWDLDGDGQFGETGTEAERGDELGATPTFDSTGLIPASYTVTLRVIDEAGDATDSTAEVVVEPALLTVQQIVVNDGAAQRSNIETLKIFVTGNYDVQSLIDSGQIVDVVGLFRTTGAPGQVGLTSSQFQWNAGLGVLTIDLTTDGFGGSRKTLLNDARYELRLKDTVFADTDGLLDGLFRFGFHRLEADFDGNRTVDVADRNLFFARLGAASNSPNYDYAVDLDGNGTINTLDYYIWVRQYRKSV